MHPPASKWIFRLQSSPPRCSYITLDGQYPTHVVIIESQGAGNYAVMVNIKSSLLMKSLTTQWIAELLSILLCPCRKAEYAPWSRLEILSLRDHEDLNLRSRRLLSICQDIGPVERNPDRTSYSAKATLFSCVSSISVELPTACQHSKMDDATARSTCLHFSYIDTLTRLFFLFLCSRYFCRSSAQRCIHPMRRVLLFPFSWRLECDDAGKESFHFDISKFGITFKIHAYKGLMPRIVETVFSDMMTRPISRYCFLRRAESISTSSYYSIVNCKLKSSTLRATPAASISARVIRANNKYKRNTSAS
jgi:hypothetical protein